MSVKTLLRDEIESEIEALKDVEMGSEPYKTSVDGLSKLLDKYNEMDKTELEYQDRFDSREAEQELKMKQLEDERKDRNVKNVITVLTAIGGAGLTIWGTIKSIKFEETGSITTIMGRGFINKLLPKK